MLAMGTSLLVRYLSEALGNTACKSRRLVFVDRSEAEDIVLAFVIAFLRRVGN